MISPHVRHGFYSLFHGTSVTILRDGPGVALYFWTYGLMKTYFGRQNVDSGVLMTPLQALLASSSAGVAFWVWALPVDTLKTSIQAPGNEKRSPTSIARGMYRYEGGIYRFFRGWQAAYLRGVPGAAVTLLVYDELKRRGL